METKLRTENKMGTMPVGRLLANMALPMVISMLVQALYNVVDSVYVSRVSENALTAVSMAFPIQNLMIGFSTGVGVGMNSLLSKCLGSREYDRGNLTAGNGLVLSGICCLLFMLFGAFGAGVFFRVQTDIPEILTGGVEYLQICTLFSFGIFGEILFERLLQATGRTLYTMITQGVGAVLNIVLDPLFIYTLGMGIRGAGAATALSQVMVWAALLWFYVRGKTSVRISVRQVARTPRMVKLIFTTGFPSLCRHCGNALATIVLNRAAGGFGDAAIAAFSIASRVSGLALSVSIGFVQGLQPVAGYAHGSKDHARLKSAFRFCCAASMSALTALAVIIAAAAPWIVRMLSPSDGGLVETGAAGLRAASIALPFTTFINCTGTLFQAIRESARSSALVLGKQVCIYIPLLLALPRAWSMNGLMAAMPLADALGFLAALWMARSYFRRAQHAAAL